jgi:hypothetical protein
LAVEEAVMKNRSGFALEATLFVLVLMTVLMLTMYSAAVSTTRSSALDYQAARVAYAAEGGADAILAQLADLLEDGVLEDAELGAIQPPEVEGFEFSDFNVEKIGGVEVESVTDGPFAGLYSLTQNLEITSQATDPYGNTSSVIVSAKAQAFPIFQFGVFFEKDLEVTPAPTMNFRGWVHSNGNIYLSSRNAYFHNSITTPNQVIHNKKSRNEVLTGVKISNASGSLQRLDFDSRTNPNPATFRVLSDATFDNRLRTNAYDVDSLKLPLPEGVDAYELLRPRDFDDGELERAAKFSWKADFYAIVDLMNLNPGQGNPAAELCAKMVVTRSGSKEIPAQPDCADIFDFSWETFWDGRERRYVDVMEIDLDALFDWSAGIPSRTVNVLYVGFVNQASGRDPSGDGVFPVVRLENGQTLANAITIATDRPLYVLRDFNIGPWQPASIAGDAVTVLSNAWDDSRQQEARVRRYGAATTQIYAAILAGHSETPCDWYDAGCTVVWAQRGGQLENFPRFLESWSGRALNFSGSLVSMTVAQYATGQFVCCSSYYYPPARNWSFDTRFQDPQNLPPGTPVVGNIIHTAFRPVY